MGEIDIIVKQLDGLSFAGKTDDGHWMTADTSKEAGGNAGAATPMEMVLMAMASCASMDAVFMLKKMKQVYTDYRVKVHATRTDGEPAVFDKIHLHYIITGKGLLQNKVERACFLAIDKYCSVAAMLRDTVEITRDVEIVEA